MTQRKTRLGHLVDAAARASENTSGRVRPATVRNVTSLAFFLAIGGVVWGLFEGIEFRVLLGLAAMFLGIVSGWAQLSFIMNQRGAGGDSRARKVAISMTVLSILATVIGVILLFSDVLEPSQILVGAFAGFAILLAVVLIVAPWWITLIANLGAQEAQTAREQLRLDFTARLHDSVLQTLALIQLNADNPQKVAALAHAQERDLREWLYGDGDDGVTGAGGVTGGSIGGARAAAAGTATSGSPSAAMQGEAGEASAAFAAAGSAHSESSTLGAPFTETAAPAMPSPLSGNMAASGMRNGAATARGSASESLAHVLKRVAASVEDTTERQIEVVTVGDHAASEQTEPLISAAREAMLNAARHGAPPYSVYMEVNGDFLQIFVRDHGAGFDAEHLPAGHLGVSESILGRMKRSGGTADIDSRPGWGTEVKLTLRSDSSQESR